MLRCWTKLFGSLAEAEYDGHHWTFKRGGFLRPHVTVRAQASDEDLAVLDLSWGGSGLLRMRSGARFRWDRIGFWGRRFAFTDEKGVELIGIEPKFGFVRRTATIDISAAAARMPELGLLVALGWYVIMLIIDDEAAGGAVICCS